jgi:hypothetical protein
MRQPLLLYLIAPLDSHIAINFLRFCTFQDSRQDCSTQFAYGEPLLTIGT